VYNTQETLVNTAVWHALQWSCENTHRLSLNSLDSIQHGFFDKFVLHNITLVDVVKIK